MKLSIIIPVYCVEDTLDRCIESVIRQEYTDYEMILVDDGSPDNCPQKCDEWASRDSRIIVIHKQNGGLSEARNYGIDIAQGDYVTFIDSDDFIREDTYAPLMKKLAERPDIDILEYPVYVFYGSSKQHLLDFSNEKEYHNMDDYWYEGQAYQHTYAWNKIYRAEIFKETRYPVGIIFEDVYTLPNLLKHSQIVATSRQGLYYYCINQSGITSTSGGKGLQMLLKPHVDIICQAERNDYWFQKYYMHVLNIQMDVYEQTGASPILPEREIDTKYFTGVQKIKASAFKHLGIKKICKLNKVIHKIWKSR